MNVQTAPDQAIAVTRQIASWIAGFDGNAPQARVWARHTLLDWLAVTLPGADEPPVAILRDTYATAGPASLIGPGSPRTAEEAALINGTAGHVIDYDDGSLVMNGHATAPVAPAILAVAEEVGASGADLIDAMIIGQEVECQLGQMMAPDHYQSGFHATTTIGAIGAAAGAARLFKLTEDQAAHALGLAATQAAGLKSMFGSMTKSFQVGKAAMNGIMAARLAKAGFTANPDGLETAQGMGPVMSTSFAPAPFVPGGMDRWGVAYNVFKYHGACLMTHSAIEAARRIGEQTGWKPADIAAVDIDVAPAILTVADQPEPRTGLEAKFSIRHLVMAGLRGDPTADVSCYSDAFANDPELVAARKLVRLNAPPEHATMLMAAKVRMVTQNGQMHEVDFDATQLATDTDQQWRDLSGKARALLPASTAEVLISGVDGIEDAASVTGFLNGFL